MQLKVHTFLTALLDNVKHRTTERVVIKHRAKRRGGSAPRSFNFGIRWQSFWLWWSITVPTVSTGQEPGWPTEKTWTRWQTGKFLDLPVVYPCRCSNPSCLSNWPPAVGLQMTGAFSRYKNTFLGYSDRSRRSGSA